MTEQLLQQIAARHELVALDAGEMSTFKANGMTFSVRAYHAKGLGHVSVMRAKGFFGLMKMDTLIINPTERDLPLYSYDRIFAAGNDTLIIELYDTTLEVFDEDAMQALLDAYADLAERDPGEHWYDSIKLSASISKKAKKKQTPRVDALTLVHFDAYITAKVPVVSDPSAKNEKTLSYVNGLLTQGGPSTDVFKKVLGEDRTSELFHRVLFGV
jgi:hypothetical protein